MHMDLQPLVPVQGIGQGVVMVRKLKVGQVPDAPWLKPSQALSPGDAGGTPVRRAALAATGSYVWVRMEQWSPFTL
jgi:hypothetical protein